MKVSSTLLPLIWAARHSGDAFTAAPPPSPFPRSRENRRPASSRAAAAAAADPNAYNVDVETAAELWTVSVSPEQRTGRPAGVPYMDVASKDHYVDDVRVSVSRSGGLGLELLELAGGRPGDDYGITVISAVSGNAAAAGVAPGDAIAGVEVRRMSGGRDATADGVVVSSDESVQAFGCECRNFDTTIGLLGSFPPEVDALTLDLKRIRRWPKLRVVVEYPPVQCAEGADNKETLELFGGENLMQALQTRGVVFEDRDAARCDFCGGKCAVKIDQGMSLLSPMSTTEELLMKRNPKCRLSCKTVVGYNMQEGNIRLKVNLNEWKAIDQTSNSNPFFMR